MSMSDKVLPYDLHFTQILDSENTDLKSVILEQTNQPKIQIETYRSEAFLMRHLEKSVKTIKVCLR